MRLRLLITIFLFLAITTMPPPSSATEGMPTEGIAIPDDTQEILSGSGWTLDLEESGLPSPSNSRSRNADRLAKPLPPDEWKPRLFFTQYLSVSGQDDFHPLLEEVISTWTETSMQTRLSISPRKGESVSIGWLDGRLRQENHFYQDTDFYLQRQGPFLDYDLALPPAMRLNLRIRDEAFTDRNDAAFYRLGEETHLLTGYLVLSYQDDDFWLTANTLRERETDPVYDFANRRAILNIRARTLSGLASGLILTRNLELSGSIYHESYGTDRPDQWNPNLQLHHWPDILPGLRISLGGGYYTEEREQLFNLAIAKQWRPISSMSLQFEYQTEYSENEASWLNEVGLLCSWALGRDFFFDARARYGRESGGDRDEEFFLQGSLRLAVF